MIKLEIRVKILPYKRNEFIQAVKDICSSKSSVESVSPFTVFQHLEDENLFSCIGEWDSRQKLENDMKSLSYETLVGAIQVLGDVQYACIHHIHTTEEIRI